MSTYCVSSRLLCFCRSHPPTPCRASHAKPVWTAEHVTNTISGTAPYWRVALEQNRGNHSFEIGTYGLLAKIIPGPGVDGPEDSYRDYAFDAQYQYVYDRNILTARATWIYEKQEWDASLPAGYVANSATLL
jgi:hypothetical protein